MRIKHNILNTPQNEQEAWIAIAYACLMTDRKKTSFSEIERFCHLLLIKSHFKGHNTIAYIQKCEHIHALIGSEQLIERCSTKISENNKATLFALVVDMLLIRGALNPMQKKIIDFLANQLKLDKVLSASIKKIMLIKNKGNILTDLIK